MTVIDDLAMPASASQDVAALVRDVVAQAGPEGLEYREVLRRIDKRGFAVFILFAAVLLFIPIGLVLPQIAALTLIVCGLGLLFGAQAPWLPGVLGKRKASRAGLEKLAAFLADQQSWSHWLLTPRHREFALDAGERVAAIGLLLLGLSVALPLPTAAPALGALAFGFGLLQRDGLVMTIGTAVAFGWAAFLATMVVGVAMNAPFAGGWAHDQAPWLIDQFTPHAAAS